MSTRCKPGELAIITNDVPSCTPNIGRIVEVCGPPEFNRVGQVTWIIMPVTDEPYMVNDQDGHFVGFMDYQEIGIEHPDEWLMPIKQETVDIDAQEHHDRELECET